MNTRKAWAVYIVARVLFFAAPFTVFMLIGWPWWLAMAIATLIAFALSVIFLSKQRDTASTGIYEWRMRDRTADDIEEDSALDSEAPATRPDGGDSHTDSVSGSDGGQDASKRI